jgi:hypothetical protein
MEIRGYGPVKEQAVSRVKAEVAAKLAALQNADKARNAGRVPVRSPIPSRQTDVRNA